MELSFLKVVLILVSGLIAGFVNVLAGGGSFLTLAVLEWSGLPAAMANATNRLGVVSQNFMGVMGFRSKGVGDLKTSVQFGIPAFLGAIVGAYVVVDLPKVLFHRILAVAMIIVLFTVIFDVKRWLKQTSFEMTTRRRVITYIVCFLIGVYAGAIQAGVGFFIIVALVMIAGRDLVVTNAYKVLVVGMCTIVALVIFILRGQINWIPGIILGVGNGIGGWVASRLAVEKGEKLVKVVLTIMLTFVALQYLGIIPEFKL